MSSLLWSPLEIRGMRLANRVAVAPMASGTAGDQGTPGEKGMEQYRRFARSGAGLAVLEHHAVRKDGYVRRGQYSLHDDALVEKHRPLAGVFEDAGMPVLVQINHAGSAVKDQALIDAGHEPIAPSPVAHPGGSPAVPREMTSRECQDMVEDFVRGARRALDAGYSGVELHACHGFLLGQFLSPLTNHRTDAYGGNIAGRSRLLRDITAALREVLGDAPLSVRLAVADELGEKPRGLAFEDVLWTAGELEALGADMLSVSGNFCGFDASWSAPWAPYAEAIQEKLPKTPVLCTGNIRTPKEAEELLQKGACRLVGVGRPLVKNPDFLGTWR